MGLTRAQMPRQLYSEGTSPAELMAQRAGISMEEAQLILNNMENETREYLGYANGGIAGLALRPEYGLGGFVKSAFKGVKSAVSGITDAATDFAKSDIGKIALAVAAPYALGAIAPGFATLGGTGFAGNALRAGIANLATQGITTGKFDLGQAAKTGIIAGGINTGIQNYRETGNAFQGGDVTKGGDILESTVAGPSPEQFARQTSLPADAAAPSVSEAVSKPVTFEEAFGEGATLSDIQKTQAAPTTTATATPQTPTISPSISEPTFSFDPSEPISGGVGMEPITGKYGQTTGTRFTDTEGAISTIKGPVEDVSLASRGSNILESSQDIFSEGATVAERANSAVDALKQISGAALDRPLSTIAVASLISAASVPKQPDETDFDYEERLKLVNSFAKDYGDRAGVTNILPEAGQSFEEFYSSRANVAVGGLPEVPMGKVRQNSQGIQELDYRQDGGFVPVGIKEKADDVPAMLSKNEFVFTAEAVRNAGDGDVDKGAEKLYSTMKTLENGGTLA